MKNAENNAVVFVVLVFSFVILTPYQVRGKLQSGSHEITGALGFLLEPALDFDRGQE